MPTWLRYSLLRFLIFFACVLALWLVGLRSPAQIPWLVVGAAVLSIIISALALAPMRARMVEEIEARRRGEAPVAPPRRDTLDEDAESDGDYR